jgi:hypothetical protein
MSAAVANQATADLLARWLDARLAPGARAWHARARAELAASADDLRLSELLSRASRHVHQRAPLAPTAAERAAMAREVAGVEVERWSLLETARVSLVLSRPVWTAADAASRLEDAFRYADLGELVALYRSLALLPQPERFRWRAGEGARSNMRAVFEAACCDTPYPARYFDAIAWRQAAIKALFVGAPLWRLFDFDRRLDADLARMALDLCDERRSAGREVPPELWMCLGSFGGPRARAAIERELAGGAPRGRAAAALAIVRAGPAAQDLLPAARQVLTAPGSPRELAGAVQGPVEARAFAALAGAS